MSFFNRLFGRKPQDIDRQALESISEELNRPARLTDLPRWIRLCEQALTLVGRVWAALLNELANSLAQTPLGARAENLERAIGHYEQVLAVYTREGFPEQWSMTQNNLAAAYYFRIQGERVENLERAIGLFEQALAVRTREAFPEDWAATQNNLAAAYVDRIRGDRAENLERAIEHYELALAVRTRDAFPKDWAATHNNLAIAYSDRIRGQRAENLEQAIGHYEQALAVRTQKAFSKDWAATQNNLGNAYCFRIQGERAENLERAIGHYEQALAVRTRDAFPEDWAATQNNLALAYSDRIRDERAENLERAIGHYEQALVVRTWDAFPEDWAATQNNLANAYSDRIRGERAENLERAIGHFEQALVVRTRDAFPEDWAATQNNLAAAYSDRIRGERAENLEQAIGHYEQALAVRTRNAFPEDWAATQNNLGEVYRTRIRGERAENLEQAIGHFEQVLAVYTREAFPEKWADTQNNLAAAYSDRIRGERTENLERAIGHYEQALAVRTRDAFPEKWAATQNNLADAYSDRIRGERAENIERAIEHYELALAVRTRDAFPEKWAATQNNLADAYSDRIRGERAENIERAIEHYELALAVFSPKALPANCRRTAHNLANLLFDQRRYADAIHPYRLVFQAEDILLRQSFSREGLEAELAETQGLGGRTSYALAQTGDLPGAVETLEAGLAHLLAQALEQNRRDLERLPDLGYPHLLERYRQVARHLQTLRRPVQSADQLVEKSSQPDGTARLQEIEAAQQELDEAVDAIRLVEIDGSCPYEDFLRPLTFDKIHQAATSDAPLVYLMTTSAGSLALVVQQNGAPLAIWLGDVDESELEDLLFDRAGTAGYLHGTVLGPVSLSKTVLDAMLPLLHERLVTPIAAQLLQLGYRQAVFIPTGRLSLLPLHALALDQLTIRFLPSAAALSSVLQDEDHLNLPPRLLAVGNPASQGQTSLAFARQEAEEIASLFDQLGYQHVEFCEESAKLKDLTRLIAGITHLHFSCHGRFDMDSPLASALYLAGTDKLILRNVLDGDVDVSRARLAVLSACQTGITDFKSVPDEAVGFPAGFLQAGVPGLVSTLWSVNDLSTALLMTQFYRYHLVDGVEPAEALRRAQLWLRDATAGELNLAERFDKLYHLTSDRQQQAAYWQSMKHHRACPDEKPYDHPYYWAPFVFTGA